MKLLEDVLQRVKPVKCTKSWRDRLPSDVAAEVDTVRDQYRSGKLGDQNVTRLAVAIVESLTERGIEMPRARQVAIWLNEKP